MNFDIIVLIFGALGVVIHFFVYHMYSDWREETYENLPNKIIISEAVSFILILAAIFIFIVKMYV